MRNYVEYKGSRYSSEKEMAEEQAVVDWKKLDFQGGGFPVFTDLEKGESVVASGDIHTMIIGSTGSKKSKSGVLPTLLSLIGHGESVIVADAKMEAYNFLMPWLKEKQVKVNVLDFRNRQYGNRYNPLSVPYRYWKEGKKDQAVGLLKDVGASIFGELGNQCDDIFWSRMSEEYFVGLALILFDEAKEEEVTLENIMNLHTEGGRKFGGVTLLEKYMERNKEQNPMMYMCLQGTVLAPNETRQSIKSVFSQPMGNITCQDGLNDMLCRSDFDVCDMGKEQTVTFIIMQDEKSTYNNLVSVFMKQTYELLIETAHEEYDGCLPVRVNFMLEEAGNIPPLPDFDKMLAAARSRNIRFFLVFQSQDQIHKQYKNADRLIMGNCDCIVYFHSKDMELVEYLSRLAGKYQQRYTGRELPLISETQLLHLSKKEGECLIFLERKYPFRTWMPMIYEYARFLPKLEAAMEKREPRTMEKRLLFDLRTLVAEREKKKLQELMSEYEKKEEETRTRQNRKFGEGLIRGRDQRGNREPFSSKSMHELTEAEIEKITAEIKRELAEKEKEREKNAEWRTNEPG